MPKHQTKIIDGKKLADEILQDLRGKVGKLLRRPGLAAILVGDDQASKLYIRNKRRACEKIGITFHEYRCAGKSHPRDTEQDIINTITFLNNDPQIDGIIVQLPIPQKFNTQKIIDTVDPQKDVDGFHPQNKKEFIDGSYVITPPLINAINTALQSTGQNFYGKKAVIVAKGPVFSQPMKESLERQGLAVTLIKPAGDFGSVVKSADVLISIVGQPATITKEMVKPESIVIDIGTTLLGDETWSGDVATDVAEVADYLTPVPGGIGPLTVAMLLRGTYELAKARQGQG